MTDKKTFSLIRLVCLSQLMTECMDDLRNTQYYKLFDKISLKRITNQSLKTNNQLQPKLIEAEEGITQEYTNAIEFFINQISEMRPDELIYSYQKQIGKL